MPKRKMMGGKFKKSTMDKVRADYKNNPGKDPFSKVRTAAPPSVKPKIKPSSSSSTRPYRSDIAAVRG